MKRTTRIGVLIAVALPLLAVAFYIRYRPELEDRLLPPIITIKSPLNGSTLKNTRVKVEICCERIQTRGYSLTANLNGNRINHKLGVSGNCFSGIIKCDPGYNLLKVEIYRQNRLLSYAISRFTIVPEKPALREGVSTGPPSATGREEKDISYQSRISEVGADAPVGPNIVAEAPPAPTEVSRTGSGETGGLLTQDRTESEKEEDEPPEPSVEEEIVELLITIETPVSGSLTNQPFQDVGGSASPGMQVTLIDPRTGGLHVTLATSSGEYLFSSVAFNEGMNQVIATVSDTEGNTASASSSFLVDTTPPPVTIDRPKDKSINFSRNLNVDGSTEPDTVVEIMAPYSSTRSNELGNFSFSQVAFNEGSNSLTVRATDAANNIGAKTVNFKIDTIRPGINCESPKELECTDTVDIIGRTEPNCRVKVLDRDLQTASDAEGSFIFPDVRFPGGKNTIILRATDPAGNSFDAALTFEVDTTPPGITLINPQNGSVINPRTQDITGRTTEPFCMVEISDPLSGENIKVMNNEDGSFIFPGITFPEGLNSLTVKATDRCGWEGSSTISFFAEPDFYRVTMDFCDELENPLDSSVVTQFAMCVYVNLPEQERSLGAYHFYISFDPEVVELRSVSGGEAVEFSSVSARVNNTIDPGTGLATSHFHEANNGSTGWTAPSGMEINVAKLTFEVIDPGTSILELSIRTLDDNNRQPISGFVKNGFVEVQ